MEFFPLPLAAPPASRNLFDTVQTRLQVGARDVGESNERKITIIFLFAEACYFKE